MKREDWQRVYVPRGDALDVRVRRTLRTLGDAPVRRMKMKKGIALALCAVLALASAVALAAGLLFSDRVDVQTKAEQALTQRYGLTQAQQDAMALHTDWLGLGHVGDRPVYEIWFWLWQGGDETWREGNGLYGAYVNAETGVIEETFYDNTLGGNG